jgi:purine-nucleoside phosphorylase
MYTRTLRELAKAEAEKQGIDLKEGVYFYATGPQFETPAEIRAMRILGGDAVGMSTVTEAITAAHCGMEVLGISLITNMAAGVLDQPVTTEEVDLEGRKAKDKLERLITSVVGAM